MENKRARKSNWYVINVVSGKDEKAKELLEFELKVKNLDQYVNEIIIPIEKYKTVKNRKQVIKERNMLNGYMFISVNNLHPEIVQTVNSTNFVIGFLGQNKRSRKNPVPISYREAERMMGLHNQEPVEIKLKENDEVEIINGAFSTFKGNIKSIDTDKEKVTISVSVFGRITDVELPLEDVKSVNE